MAPARLGCRRPRHTRVHVDAAPTCQRQRRPSARTRAPPAAQAGQPPTSQRAHPPQPRSLQRAQLCRATFARAASASPISLAPAIASRQLRPPARSRVRRASTSTVSTRPTKSSHAGTRASECDGPMATSTVRPSASASAPKRSQFSALPCVKRESTERATPSASALPAACARAATCATRSMPPASAARSWAAESGEKKALWSSWSACSCSCAGVASERSERSGGRPPSRQAARWRSYVYLTY
mmetsp:Transcript_8198/g.21601  ORF Transcript_8198/g.21601 Transcript_8198/m.21601 type:complete len:243 (-) Transcript_8198:316-1044(-)